jgi:hypothetical protein
MFSLDGLDGVGHGADRLIVRHLGKPAGRGTIPAIRMEQAVGMRSLQISFDTLGAEHSTVEGEFFPRLKANYFVALDLQLNAALLSAEAAMGFDETIGLHAGVQSLPRIKRRVRAEAFGGLQFIRG